jgi:HEAT repeat protein
MRSGSEHQPESATGSTPITVGDIVNSVGVAIGPNASVTVVAGPPPLSPEESAHLLAEYRARVLEETRYVNLRGIPLPRGRDGRPMPLQVPLDKVYIRIQATTEKQRRAQEEAEERSLSDQLKDESAAHSKRATPETGIRRLFGRLRGESKSESSPRDILSTLHILGEHFYRRGEVYEAEHRPEPGDPQEALNKHRRLVILGAPGAGKSTILRYLARRAAEDSSGFAPIQVSLRDYATALAGDNTLALSEFALRVASVGNATLRQALEDEIENGQVLWLVDALDEARGWAANAARQAGRLPGQLILTSRPVGYVSTGLESLPHFEVLPLTPENVDEFLQSWFDLLAAQRAADDEWTAARVIWLKKQLEVRPRILALTRNPLLLTFLVILAGEDPLHDLPDKRAELYRRYIEELLDSWEAERRPRSGAEGLPAFTLGPLQGEQARQAALQGFYFLGWSLHLAYYGGKPKGPPTHDVLIRTLTECLQIDWGNDAKSLAGAILEFWQEAGLLETWHLAGNDYLAFRHLTFQEYAAAWRIAESWKRDPKRAWKFLRPRLHHYAWYEPLLLLVGLMDKVHLNNLAHHLLCGPSPYENSLHRDLFLCCELLGEGAELDRVPQIVRKLDWLRRRHFIKCLTTIFLTYLFGMLVLTTLGGVSWCLILPLFTIFFWGSMLYLPMIERILAYPTRIWGSIPDRTNVFLGLGQSGPLAIPPLFQSLQEGNDLLWNTSDVRSGAAEALGQIGDAQAVPSLLRALHDRDRDVRCSVVEALGRIGDVHAVPALLQALNDSNMNIVWKTIEALGQIGNAQAISGLVQALGDWRSPVPGKAAEALVKIGPPAVPSLVQALQNRDNNVRRIAADTLGQIGVAQAVPGLIQALQDSDKLVCISAAKALGQIEGDAQALPNLIEALQDMGWLVRFGAVEALGQIEVLQAIPHLLRTLQDENPYVRRRTVEVLGQIGDPQAIPGLIQALQDRHIDVRCSAAEALGQIGDAGAILVLLQALQDRHQYVRRNAAKALGRIANAQAISGLIQALEDSDWSVPFEAAKALVQIGPPAVPSLVQTLQNRDNNVRRIAADTLGQIGAAQAMPGLIQALQDSDRDVRYSAAEALGQIGDMQAVPHLICAMQDEDPDVRGNAAKALGQIGDIQVVPGLIMALQDRHDYVRLKVVEALGQIGGVQAVRALLLALQNTSVEGGEAAKALGQIGDPQAITGLFQAMRSGDMYVCRCAAEALGRIGGAKTVSYLIWALQNRDKTVRICAVGALADCADKMSGNKIYKCAMRALWWCLTDQGESVAETAFRALEQIANRLSVLEVEAMPLVDPLLPAPKRSKKRK